MENVILWINRLKCAFYLTRTINKINVEYCCNVCLKYLANLRNGYNLQNIKLFNFYSFYGDNLCMMKAKQCCQRYFIAKDFRAAEQMKST